MFAIAAAAAAAASPSLADDQLHAVHVGEATAAAAAARSTQSAHTSNNQGQRAPSEVDDAEDNDGNQWTEESLKELKNKELQAILVGLGLRKTGNKKDLIDRILGREVVVDKRKKKIKWRNSKARAMLVRMLMDKDSNAHTMTWQQLHSSHEWFQEYDAKSFQRYVSELKKANPKKIAVVTEDNKIINAELQKFPRPDKTLRGEPFWDTHPSKLLLRQDVKLGKHLEMKPKTLHQTRLEYQAFSLKTFRQHVYQEKRHQKELPMRVNRRNKKAQYKYEKEVKENVTIWEAEMSGRDDEMIEAVLSDEVLSDEDDLRWEWDIASELYNRVMQHLFGNSKRYSEEFGLGLSDFTSEEAYYAQIQALAETEGLCIQLYELEDFDSSNRASPLPFRQYEPQNSDDVQGLAYVLRDGPCHHALHPHPTKDPTDDSDDDSVPDLITPLPTNVNVPKQSSSLEKMMGFIGLSSAKKSAAEGSEYQSPAPSSTSVKGTSKQKSWSNPRHLSGAFDVEAMSTASTVQTSGSKKNPPPPEKKRRNMSIQASTPPPPPLRRSTRNKKNKGGRVGSNK